MDNFLLGIDHGGSTLKCALFDLCGHEVSVVSSPLPTVNHFPGWEERDLNFVWTTLCNLLQKLLIQANVPGDSIISIGITGYGCGICFVDANGSPVYNAVISSDTRATDLCNSLIASGVEDFIYPKTGQTLWPAQTAVLMRWFKDNMPEILEKTSYVLSIKDYLRMKLSDRPCYEITESTCSGLMNLHTHQFDPEIFHALNLEKYQELMPERASVTKISSYVSNKASKLTTLKEGTPIAGSCYDINACAMASNIHNTHTLCMITGTWSINEILTTHLINGAPAIGQSYLPKYYILEESSPTSAGNFEWFLKNIIESEFCTLSRSQIYKLCNQMVESVSAEDSVPIFIPYVLASASAPNTQGAFLNLNSYHKIQHLIRSIYEGIVFSSVFHVEKLKSYGITFDTIKLSGGITHSDVWVQIMCDALQTPIQVCEASEPGALGAAICAALAINVYPDYQTAALHMTHIRKELKPNLKLASIYQQKYEHYKKAISALDQLSVAINH